MIKITLLGDSIRMNYGKYVPSLLGENFEVYQPEENCRFSKYTLRGLFEWKKEMKNTNIVHWNNGLWDFCNLYGDGPFTSEKEYIDNMTRIADILLQRYDKVIFATTTPVTDNNPYDSNITIEKYNKLIVPVLKEKGIIINDLHSTVVKNIDKYIRKEDNIHLTEEGAVVCAKQVSEIILKVAETMDISSTKKANSSDDELDTTGAPVLI